MKLKKFSAMLCAAVICLAMSACASDSNTAEETVSETASSETTAALEDNSASADTSAGNSDSDTEEKDNPAKRMIKFDLPEGFKLKGDNFNETAYGDGVANIILKANYNEEGYPPVAEFEETGRLMNMFTYSSFEVEYSDAISFTLCGYDAVESTFVVRDPDDKTNAAKYRSVYVETETCAYILTLGSLEQDFDSYNDVFNKVIDSVQFIKE